MFGYEDERASDSGVWDKRMKKTMIGAFVFFAAGLLFAWGFGKFNGTAEERPADATAREQAYWKQIQFLNPNYPDDLRDEVTEMGWRACGKLESGWTPTQVLSFLMEDNSAPDPQKLPTPATQVMFWMGVEQSAALAICPDQASKLEGWMENLEPKTVTVPETA
ncbi:DUF732 domain-containing protein [Mobiluncus porci]|uniref:DUF732 domain-containing protein n=1 Tax=Mobiluncus porci TaxID=2652278 RepID=A0A7K0K588_9ACTO|nr:DUF732 domain-containing protein [Mobiluncus porci]MST50642.1 DUF732 domain-containing protein [Mobiluncus porci]